MQSIVLLLIHKSLYKCLLCCVYSSLAPFTVFAALFAVWRALTQLLTTLNRPPRFSSKRVSCENFSRPHFSTNSLPGPFVNLNSQQTDNTVFKITGKIWTKGFTHICIYIYIHVYQKNSFCGNTNTHTHTHIYILYIYIYIYIYIPGDTQTQP